MKLMAQLLHQCRWGLRMAQITIPPMPTATSTKTPIVSPDLPWFEFDPQPPIIPPPIFVQPQLPIIPLHENNETMSTNAMIAPTATPVRFVAMNSYLLLDWRAQCLWVVGNVIQSVPDQTYFRRTESGTTTSVSSCPSWDPSSYPSSFPSSFPPYSHHASSTSCRGA